MASVNKVILIGNCGSDPTTRYLPNGDACANVSIACTETWKDAAGDKKERTEWVRLVFWRRLAEIVEEYVGKGDSIYIEGKLQTRDYEKDGVKHYITEVICDKLTMLGSKRDRGDTGGSGRDTDSAPAPAARAAAKAKPGDDFDDDIPFS